MTVNGLCHSTSAIKILYKNIVKHILFKVNAASADWFLNMEK